MFSRLFSINKSYLTTMSSAEEEKLLGYGPSAQKKKALKRKAKAEAARRAATKEVADAPRTVPEAAATPVKPKPTSDVPPPADAEEASAFVTPLHPRTSMGKKPRANSPLGGVEEEKGTSSEENDSEYEDEEEDFQTGGGSRLFENLDNVAPSVASTTSSRNLSSAA